MRISLADSCTNGFNKWCSIHDAGRGENDRDGAVVIIDADQDVGRAATPSGRSDPGLGQPSVRLA
jgi:hypothetical protein